MVEAFAQTFFSLGIAILGSSFPSTTSLETGQIPVARNPLMMASLVMLSNGPHVSWAMSFRVMGPLFFA